MSETSHPEFPPRPAWVRALEHVRALVSTGSGLPGDLDVTVNFHPDRDADGMPLLHRLTVDGVYRSQFETGTGNGGLTAVPGGNRWRWEHRIFGGAYDDAAAEERPKYGALNFRGRAIGGSARFGSAYLRLAPHVLSRVTFCYPDSVAEPSAFGTTVHMPLLQLAAGAAPDVLDDYIEAQMHGPLTLSRDMVELVLDPSFRGTAVEAAAGLLPFPVSWHPGFRLSVDTLAAHEGFRGPGAVELGREVAVDGWLTPRVLGEALQRGGHDESRMKYLWHCVARFGYDWEARC